MKYADVICKKASEYQNKTVIFELDNHVGFLFESENGKIPKAITHVICSTVMGKKGIKAVKEGGTYWEREFL